MELTNTVGVVYWCGRLWEAAEKERVTTWKEVAEAIRVAHTSGLARGRPGDNRPEVITIPTLAL